MTQRILALTGRKQSGKDTLANFLIGNAEELFGPGYSVVKMGLADPLKKTVSDLFGVPLDWLYGTEEDKGRPVPVKWKDLPHWEELRYSSHIGNSFLTVRELLQQFGTEIVRRMCSHAWINALQVRVRESTADLILINDARFPNEVQAIKGWGGKLIRLTRNSDLPPEHESEWALDSGYFDWNSFDSIIFNNSLSKQEQKVHLVEVLDQWGWVK